jgi:hypothetical protein
MLLAAASTAIGNWLIGKMADKAFDKVFDSVAKKDEISEKFVRSVGTVSSNLQKKYPGVLDDNIRHFFEREDIFDELFKLLFRNAEIDVEKISAEFDTETLPPGFISDFISNLRSELLKDRQFDKILSDNDLFRSVSNMEKTLQKIEDIVERIQTKKSYTTDKFIQTYSKNALNNLSQVNYIGLAIQIKNKKRKDVRDIFVRPKLVLRQQGNAGNQDKFDLISDEKNISYGKLLEINDKIVILGNPGAGKSLLIRAIICDLLDNGKTFDRAFYEYIPFRIELRKYLTFKKEGKGNVLNYLAFLLDAEYQIFNITTTDLEKILSDKRSIFFFDGLDEIFDINRKLEIKNDIENFQNFYSGIRSVVTSRISGYEEARLNEKFAEIGIQVFGDVQIKQYIKKWYSKEEENPTRRKKEVEAFLKRKDEIDEELIRNPLLLSLIVLLYRNDPLNLPESKLEIYKSCTNTLVDKFEASKELQIGLEPEILNNRDKILADLAYWQYIQLSKKGGKIDYSSAKRVVEMTLRDKCKIDENISDEKAGDFMAYAEKRSIYFDNNFTHKTFLEYYTAYWIYSNIEKKHKVEDRNELITEYVNNPFWYIVIELLISFIATDQPDKDVMDEIVAIQIQRNEQCLPFFISILPLLEKTTTDKVSHVIGRSIELLLNCERDYSTGGKAEYAESVELKIFSGLQKLGDRSEKWHRVLLNELAVKETQVKQASMYILQYELMFRRHFGEQTSEFQDIETYTLLKENDPYLYALDFYMSISQNGDDNLFNGLKFFLKRFGNERFFKQFELRYEIDAYFLELIIPALRFLLKYSKEFPTNLKDLEFTGLDRQSLITYLAIPQMGVEFYIREHPIKESIVDFFRTANKEFSTQVFLLLLIQLQTLQKSLLSECLENAINTDIKKALEQLGAKSKDERLKFIGEVIW